MAAIPPFLRDFDVRPASSEDDIARAEEALGAEFPNSYRAFLRTADGGEGPIGEESYLILWRTRDLPEHNAGYHVDGEYAPDLVFIGSDGGNEVFAFRRSDGHFVSAPLIGMAPDAVKPRRRDFRESLESLP